MKKFFKSMALSLVVAVFAICCLAGCGSKDEFKNGANATAADMLSVASESTNQFDSGYSMYMIAKVGKQKAMEIDMDLLMIGEDLQLAMVMGMDASLTGGSGYEEIKMYIKDNYAYANVAGQKVKEAFDPSEMSGQLSEAMDMAEIEESLMAELSKYAQLEGQGIDFKVKKLVDEETGLVRFRIYDDFEEGVKLSYTVGYLDGKIVEYAMEADAGKSGYTYLEIKALAADATIEFPADLDTYTEAV